VQKGGYFGELALVTHKPRAASVYAVGKVKLACKLNSHPSNILLFTLAIFGAWSRTAARPAICHTASIHYVGNFIFVIVMMIAHAPRAIRSPKT